MAADGLMMQGARASAGMIEYWPSYSGKFQPQLQKGQHIEAETKWPPCSRRHFQMHFLGWKCMNVDKKFHWSLFLRVKLTIFHHWFRKWLGADQATSHYLNQWWPMLSTHIYASLSLNELTLPRLCVKSSWAFNLLLPFTVLLLNWG